MAGSEVPLVPTLPMRQWENLQKQSLGGKMTKLSRWLLAMLAVFSLVAAACGDDDDDSSSSDDAASDSSSSDDSADADAGVSGTLSMLSWDNEERMQPLLDGFAEMFPDVEIEFSHAPPVDTYIQRLTLLAGADDLPDVFNVTIPITKLAREGLLADLSDLDGVQALSSAHRGAFAFDGGVYSYSPTTWIGGMFYNKDLFEDNGIALPTTVDEYLAVIEEFNSLGLQGLALEAGSLGSMAMFHYNATLHQSDPGAQSAIYTGESTFAEILQPSLEWVQEELIESGIYKEEFLGYGYEDRLQCFAVDMTCAMFEDGSWGYGGLSEYEDLNLGWMEFPNGGSLGAVSPGWSMSSTPENEAAALAWFEYLSSDEGLATYQAIGDSFMGVAMDYEVPEVMAPARAAIEAGNFNLPTIFWGNEAALAFGVFFPGMQELAAGSTTPAELAALLDETNAELIPNN